MCILTDGHGRHLDPDLFLFLGCPQEVEVITELKY